MCIWAARVFLRKVASLRREANPVERHDELVETLQDTGEAPLYEGTCGWRSKPASLKTRIALLFRPTIDGLDEGFGEGLRPDLVEGIADDANAGFRWPSCFLNEEAIACCGGPGSFEFVACLLFSLPSFSLAKKKPSHRREALFGVGHDLPVVIARMIEAVVLGDSSEAPRLDLFVVAPDSFPWAQ